MEAHRAHAGVQEQGCVALANLFTNANNRVSIPKAGGITAIVSGVEAQSEHAGIQEKKGCVTLTNLAINNVENKVLIAKAGDITAIVSGMKAHRDHAGVQEQGCFVLQNLAPGSSDNKMSIAKEGGIVAIMSGTEAHRDHAGVQKQGCCTLYNLSFDPKVAFAVKVIGGVQVLKAASKNEYAADALLNIEKSSSRNKGDDLPKDTTKNEYLAGGLLSIRKDIQKASRRRDYLPKDTTKKGRKGW